MKKCSVCKKKKKHFPKRGGLKCWACIGARRYATPWGKLLSHLRAAKQRCTDPSKCNYKHYGGKGIKFKLTHDQARQYLLPGYIELMALGLRPTIDRINPDGHYEVGNVQVLTFSDNVAKSNKDRI